ncbi:transcriptional regulator [Clostridia bacterium]|nr:transcriptional regulator [Clostridia bacterium]
MVSYKRLWKLLIDKDMKKQDLMEVAGIAPATVSKLQKGENLNTNILLKICNALQCTSDDIIEILPDAPSETEVKK